MAPRTRGKDDAGQGASDASQIAVTLDEDSVFTQLAKKHWLKSSKSSKVKVKPDVLKGEIWDVLEKEDFAFRLLLELETLQLLDR